MSQVADLETEIRDLLTNELRQMQWQMQWGHRLTLYLNSSSGVGKVFSGTICASLGLISKRGVG